MNLPNLSHLTLISGKRKRCNTVANYDNAQLLTFASIAPLAFSEDEVVPEPGGKTTSGSAPDWPKKWCVLHIDVLNNNKDMYPGGGAWLLRKMMGIIGTTNKATHVADTHRWQFLDVDLQQPIVTLCVYPSNTNAIKKYKEWGFTVQTDDRCSLQKNECGKNLKHAFCPLRVLQQKLQTKCAAYLQTHSCEQQHRCAAPGTLPVYEYRASETAPKLIVEHRSRLKRQFFKMDDLYKELKSECGCGADDDLHFFPKQLGHCWLAQMISMEYNAHVVHIKQNINNARNPSYRPVRTPTGQATKQYTEEEIEEEMQQVVWCYILDTLLDRYIRVTMSEMTWQRVQSNAAAWQRRDGIDTGSAYEDKRVYAMFLSPMAPTW